MKSESNGDIAVNYFGTLRAHAGLAREMVAIEEANSIAEILLRLAERHGEPLRSSLLDKDGKIRDWLLVSVDDEEIDKSGAVRLNAGSEIGIFSPISGG